MPHSDSHLMPTVEDHTIAAGEEEAVACTPKQKKGTSGLYMECGYFTSLHHVFHPYWSTIHCRFTHHNATKRFSTAHL